MTMYTRSNRELPSYTFPGVGQMIIHARQIYVVYIEDCITESHIRRREQIFKISNGMGMILRLRESWGLSCNPLINSRAPGQWGAACGKLICLATGYSDVPDRILCRNCRHFGHPRPGRNASELEFIQQDRVNCRIPLFKNFMGRQEANLYQDGLKASLHKHKVPLI
jgi:hypothetical protein